MDEDARQTDPQYSLHAGMQRRRHDADPASQGERILRARHGSVRADLQGLEGFGARDGDLGAPLHHGRTAPGEIFPANIPEDPEEAGRTVLERLADRRLVHEGWPEAARVTTPFVPAKAGTQSYESSALRTGFPLTRE